MIYILTGSEPYLIDNKLKQIIKENNDHEVVKYDGLNKEFSIKELINSLCEVSLFSSKSLILVKDPYFFIKKADDKDLEPLIEYCHQPLYENILVLYTFESLFNERLNIFKEVSKNAQIIRFDQLKSNEFYTCCLSIVNDRGLKINKDALNILINSCHNSLSLFNANLDIIELYPDDINIEFINNMIITSDEEDIFNLINALTNKKVNASIRFARKIMANQDNINGLISLLSNQLRFLYEVSYYYENGLSKKEIMDRTNVKSSYRIDKAIETLGKLKQKEILKLLDELSNLDYTSKSSYDIEGKERLELFIVSLLNK